MDWSSAHEAVVSGDISALRQLFLSPDLAQWGLLLGSSGKPVSSSFVPDVLHLASSLGQSAILRGFLDYLERTSDHPISAFLDLQDNVGRTPLHCAIYRLRSNCVSVLLESGANLDIEDNLGYTPKGLLTTKEGIRMLEYHVTEFQRIPLFLAQQLLPVLAYEGDFNGLGHLLDVVSELDVSVKDNMGRTALHEASQLRHTRVVCQLLDAGADCNAQDWRGSTPLHYAVNASQLDCVRVLLDHPKVNLYLTEKSSKQTALYLAVSQKKIDILALFLSRDDGQSLIRGSDDLSSRLAQTIMDMNQLEFAPLLIGSLGVEDVKLLMRFFASRGNTELVETCLKYLPSVEAINSRDQTGRTVLHEAIDSRQVTTVHTLVANGADVAIQDWRGSTSLHSAAARGDTSIVRVLLSSNASLVTLRNAAGCTPLFVALNYQMWECARVILDHCQSTDLLFVDNLGHTALHKVMVSGDNDLISFIVHRMSQCQELESCAIGVPWFVETSLKLRKFHSKHLLQNVAFSKLRLYHDRVQRHSPSLQLISSPALHEFRDFHPRSPSFLESKTMCELQRLLKELDKALSQFYVKYQCDLLGKLISGCIALANTGSQWDAGDLKVLLEQFTSKFLMAVTPEAIQTDGKADESAKRHDESNPQKSLLTLLTKLPVSPARTRVQEELIEKCIPTMQTTFSQILVGLSNSLCQSRENLANLHYLCQVLLVACRKRFWQLILWEKDCKWLTEVWRYALESCRDSGKLLVEILRHSLSSNIASLKILMLSGVQVLSKNPELLPEYQNVLCEALSLVYSLPSLLVPIMARFCAPFLCKAFHKLCSQGSFRLICAPCHEFSIDDFGVEEVFHREESQCENTSIAQSMQEACSVFCCLVSAAVRNQSSLLHESAAQGLTKLCAALLTEDFCCPFIDVNAKDGQLMTSLDRAALNGQCETSSLLLMYGAVTGDSYGKCLFATLCSSAAARADRKDCLSVLKELTNKYDMNVNGFDANIGSPLYAVVSRQWVEGARLLLDAGADPLGLGDSDRKRNPLLWALKNWDTPMAMVLAEDCLVKRFTLSACTDDGQALDTAIRQTLTVAIRNGMLDVLAVLLEHFTIPDDMFAMKCLPHLLCQSLSSLETPKNVLVCQFFDFLLHSQGFVKDRFHHCDLALRWPSSILSQCVSILQVSMESTDLDCFMFDLLLCIQYAIANDVSTSCLQEKPKPPTFKDLGMRNSFGSKDWNAYFKARNDYSNKLNDYLLGQRCMKVLRVGKWSCLHEAAARGWCHVAAVLLNLLPSDAVNTTDSLGRTALCVASAGLHDTVVGELIGHKAIVRTGVCSPIVFCVVKTLLTLLKPSRWCGIVHLLLNRNEDLATVGMQVFCDYHHQAENAAVVQQLLIYTALWKQYEQLLQGLPLKHCKSTCRDAMADIVRTLTEKIGHSCKSHYVLTQEEVGLISIAAAVSSNRTLGDIVATYASPGQLKERFRWTVTLHDIVKGLGLQYENGDIRHESVCIEVGAVDLACVYNPGKVDRNLNQEIQAAEAENCALFLLRSGCILSKPWLAAQKCYWSLIKECLTIQAYQWPLSTSDNGWEQATQSGLIAWWHIVMSALSEGETSVVSSILDAGCPDALMSVADPVAAQSLLYAAVRKRQYEIVEQLLQRDCDPLIKVPVLPYVSQKLACLGVPQATTMSPFLWAVQFGDADMVTTLLSALGDGIEALEKAGRSTGLPELAFVEVAAKSGNRTVVQLLTDIIGPASTLDGSHMVEMSAKLQAASGVHGDQCYGWFCVLMQLNAEDELLKEMEHNFSIHQPYFRLSKCSVSLSSLLENACRFNQLQVVAAIQSVVGNLELARRTAALVGIVSRYGYHELLLYILDCWKQTKEYEQILRDNIDRSDERGRTPIALAVFEGHYRCVELLIQRGANVSWIDSNSGIGLLHLACVSGSVEIVKVILEWLPMSLRNLTDKSSLDAVAYASGYGHGSLLCLLFEKKPEDVLLAHNTDGTGTVGREQRDFLLLATGWFKSLMKRNMQHSQQSRVETLPSKLFMIRSKGAECLSWKKGLAVAEVWKLAVDSGHCDVIEEIYASSFGWVVSLAHNGVLYMSSLVRHPIEKGLTSQLLSYLAFGPEVLLECSMMGSEGHLMRLYTAHACEIASRPDLASSLALNAAVRGHVSVAVFLVQTINVPVTATSSDGCTLAENAFAFGHCMEGATLLSCLSEMRSDSGRLPSVLEGCLSTIPLKLQWLLGLQFPRGDWRVGVFGRRKRIRGIAPSTLFLSSTWSVPELQCLESSVSWMTSHGWCPFTLRSVTVDVDWQSFECNVEVIRQSFGCGTLLSMELLINAFVSSDLVLGHVIGDMCTNENLQPQDAVIHYITDDVSQLALDDNFRHYFISIVHGQSWFVAVEVKGAVKTPALSLEVSADGTIKELCRKTAQLVERIAHRQVFVGLASASLSQAPADVISFLYSSSASGGLGGFCQYVADCVKLQDDVLALIPQCNSSTKCRFGTSCDGVFIDIVDKVSVRYVPGLAAIDSESIATLIQPRVGRLVWPFDVSDGKLLCLPDLFPWTLGLKQQRIFFLRCVTSMWKLHSLVKNNCLDICVDWNSFSQWCDSLKGVEKVATAVAAVLSSIRTWYSSGKRVPFGDRYEQITAKALHDINSIKIESAETDNEIGISLTSGSVHVSVTLQDGSIAPSQHSERSCCYQYGGYTVVVPNAAGLVRALFNSSYGAFGYTLIDRSLRDLSRLLRQQLQFAEVKIDEESQETIASPFILDQLASDVARISDLFSWLVDGTGTQNIRKLLCGVASNIVADDDSGFQKWTNLVGEPRVVLSNRLYDISDVQVIPFVVVDLPPHFRRLETKVCCTTTHTCKKAVTWLQASSVGDVRRKYDSGNVTVWLRITEILDHSNLSIAFDRLATVELEAIVRYLQKSPPGFSANRHDSLLDKLRSQLSHVSGQGTCLPKGRLPGVIIFDDNSTAWSIKKPDALASLLDGMRLSVAPYVVKTEQNAPSPLLRYCDGERQLLWPLMSGHPLEVAHVQETDYHPGFPVHILKVVASCEYRLRTMLQAESLRVSVRYSGGVAQSSRGLCVASDFIALCGMMEQVFREEFNKPLQYKLKQAGLSSVEPKVVLGTAISAVDIVVEALTSLDRRVEFCDGTVVLLLPVQSAMGSDRSMLQLPLRSELQEVLETVWLECCRRELASLLKQTYIPKLLHCFQLGFGRQIFSNKLLVDMNHTVGGDFVCSLQLPGASGSLLTEGPFEDIVNHMLIEDLLALSLPKGQRWLLALSSAVEMIVSCASHSRAAQYLTSCSQVKININYSVVQSHVVSLLPSGRVEFGLSMNSLAVQPSAHAIALQILTSVQNRQIPSPAASRPLLRSLHPSPQQSHIDFSMSTSLFFSSMGQQTEFKVVVASGSDHAIPGPVFGVEIDVKAYKVLKKKMITVADSVSWTWAKGVVSVLWRPASSGWYKMEIKVNGEHIRHSPCLCFVNSDRAHCSPQTQFGSGVRCVAAGSQLRFLATYDRRFQPSSSRFRFPVRSGQLHRLSAVNLLHHMRQKLADYVCVSSGDLDLWISSGIPPKNSKTIVAPGLKVVRLSDGVYYVIVTPYVASSLKLMAVLSQTQQPLSVHFADGSDNWNCLSMGFVLPGSVCPSKCLLQPLPKFKESSKLLTTVAQSADRKRTGGKPNVLKSRTGDPVVRCTAGETVELLLTAFDAYGNRHTIGGGVSRVAIKGGRRVSPSRRCSNLECEVTDRTNGTYVIRATPTSAGIKEVLVNGLAIFGQTLRVVDAGAYGPECDLVIDTTNNSWSVGKQKGLPVQLKDLYGNTVRCGEDVGFIEAHINGSACVVRRNKKRITLSVLVSPLAVGRQTLVVKVDGQHVKNSPYTLHVVDKGLLERRKRLQKSLDSHYHCSVSSSGTRSVLLRRAHLFEDAFRALRGLTGKSLHRHLGIRFDQELGHDAGGLTREFYYLVSHEIFNEGYALFSRCDSGLFRPNRRSFVNPEHLQFFSFVGKICAKAVYDGCYINAHFTPAVYKYVLALPCQMSDLELDDASIFRSLKSIAEVENPVAIEGLTFTVSDDVFGEVCEVELIPGGKQIHVTMENKLEYVEHALNWYLFGSVKQQLEAFKDGFCCLIPPRLLKSFSAEELTRLLCGQVTVDLQFVKDHTHYRRYDATSTQVRWLWTFLEEASDAFLSTFLQFVTGSGRLPLVGSNWFITIEKWMTVDELPRASTCSNTLYLPAYPSLDVLKERLTMAVNEGHQGFLLA